MARFYPLYVRRSDGKIEIVSKGKRKELNQPTAEQLDQKPDKNGVSDFYREVASDEPKHVDWRRKLAGMLARELDWKDKAGSGEEFYHATPTGRYVHGTYNARDNGYILVTFPENYRLYEHVKKTERDGKTETKSKTHAGGGNDRQDAYLYGHPAGRKKRFRSPADFFPHLLWLCTDESGDPDNCSCKICCPEDLEAAIPGAKAAKPEKPAIVKTESHESKAASISAASATPTTLSRQPSAQGAHVKPGSVGASLHQTSMPAPATPTPLPLPKIKSTEQRLDSEYGRFMFRPGELVWFRRGQAWGLGVILKRWLPQGNQRHYVVQPLSAPMVHPEPLTKTSDQDLRPWLAWSVPRYTNNVLNLLNEPPRYETADWDGIMHKRYGSGDLEVDASILAAKAIDASYTPFNFVKSVQFEAGVVENIYDGIYLGAEKIWVGEAVRTQMGAGVDILVVHQVIERIRHAPSQPGQILNQSCKLVGDSYTLQTTQHADPSIPSLAAPNRNPNLPMRLTEDLMFRNARSIPHRKLASYWKFTQSNVAIDISEIKGRWYEASLLLPILQESVFEQQAARGEVQEASYFMNCRLDCQNANRTPDQPKVPRTSVRKGSRRDALGRAVPPSTQIEDTYQSPPNIDPALQMNARTESMQVDASFQNANAGSSMKSSNNAGQKVNTPSEPMEIDPRFDTADASNSTGLNSNGGLEDFMNLEDMDELHGVPGFGQNFGGQNQGYY